MVLFAAAIFLGCIISPPSLMDDVDAVQAQIARNMLTSGDWVSARLDGVLYLEKAPLIYWFIACSYKVFGSVDWAARIPVAIACIGLGWLTAAFGVWAFGRRAGLYAGLCVSTSIGLFLFTRILIPGRDDYLHDRALDVGLPASDRSGRARPRLWAFLMAASMGVGLLLEESDRHRFPGGSRSRLPGADKAVISRSTWQRLRPFSGILIILAIAAPWHMLATLRNPPYFVFTMRSAPGEYHGFFWFYFFNEQLLRFLNMRYPRDYNTVPRLWFWLFHLLWLFPWSVYLPATVGLSYKPVDRAGRTRLLALCWLGFILVFFTFSTTQEYYSMPSYPAFALLLGSAIAAGGKWIRGGNKFLAGLSLLIACVLLAILFIVRNLPAPGDISSAFSSNPSAYTLSLGHMEDLTIESFAYLKLPLAVAAVAFLIGAIGTFKGQRTPGGSSSREYDGGLFSCRAAGARRVRSVHVVPASCRGVEQSTEGRTRSWTITITTFRPCSFTRTGPLIC